MSYDPVSAAKADLRVLVGALALGDQFPEVWASFPLGTREAYELRVASLRAFLRLRRAGRLRHDPLPSQVLAAVRRVHRLCEARAQARLERRLNRSLPSAARLILQGRNRGLRLAAEAAKRMRP